MTPAYTILANDAAPARKVNEAFRRLTWHFAGNQKPIQLTKSKELSLISSAQKGDREAMRTLVEAHYDFLGAIADRIAKETGNIPMIQDLMCDALEAFTRAVHRYKDDRESRLSTFARFSIVGELRTSTLKYGKCLAVGAGSAERTAIFRHKELKAHFEIETGRCYSGTKDDAKILARLTGLSAGSLQRGLQTRALTEISISNIEIHDQTSTAEGNYARSQSKAILKRAIDRAMQEVGPRNAQIFAMLNQSNPPRTQSVAEVMGVTPERILQIYRAAAKQIRMKLSEVGIDNLHDLSLEY